MPNVSILGGSPLGLIGVKSYYSSDGLSTFNAGKTRNVNVPNYNKNLSSGSSYGNSIFSGYRVVRAWPQLKDVTSEGADTKKDILGAADIYYNDVKDENGNIIIKKGDYSTRRPLHNDSIYDVSILNIIEKLSGTKAQLRPSDFAYLKDIGVYPNNRLMIARRFASPSGDNIMVPIKNELSSLATLISWVPENGDFLSITFGEEWMESEADFKGVLNSMGEDFRIDKISEGNLGGQAGAFGDILPLPGFTEIFQRQILAKMGIIDDDAKSMIPAGNPNLIKQAKRRKLIPYGQEGTGLKTTINIQMKCEYELKYISGIDPTIVWMDLLGMITRFGTSNSQSYGLGKNASANVIKWLNNPNTLVKDFTKNLQESLKTTIEEVKSQIDDVFDKKERQKEAKEKTAKEKAQEQKKIADDLLKSFKNIGADVINGVVQKYRVKVIGIINALSGLPSTPWHITIGNPLRPTFCSGDMLAENVTLKLGPLLAFNDLPSSISVEFSLTNARAWGLQEIMAKFNSGYLRTVDAQKTFYETNQIMSNGKVYNEAIGSLPLNDIKYDDTGVSSVSDSGNSSTNNVNPESGVSTDVGSNDSAKPQLDSTRIENGKLANKGELNSDPNGPAIKN